MEQHLENQEPKTTVLATSLTYGLITGLASIAFYIILQLTGQAFNQALSLLSLVILVGGMVLAHKSFKQGNEGYMNFSQGLGIGTLISLISGVLSSAFSVIYMTFIDPNFIAMTLEKAREQIETQNPEISSEQIDVALSFSSYMMQPGILFVFGLISTVFFGFLISLVVSAAMAKKEPVFFE